MEKQSIDINELAEMKEQISLLKNKLDREAIVNDRILRSVINDKVRHLKLAGKYKTFASLLSIPLIIWSTQFLGMSIWLTITTAIYLSTAFIYTYTTHRSINHTNTMSDSLLVVSERVAKIKQRYSSWLCFGIPITIGWFIWFFYELYQVHLPQNEFKAALIGCLVGGVIGGTFGIIRYRKVQRVADEVLTQIAEFKQNQESEE